MDDESTHDVRLVVCDLAGLTHPDAGTVDALARLQLAVRRGSCDLALRNASPALQDLLALAGLEGVLPALSISLIEMGSPVEMGGQTEQGKQLGVEKEGEPGDPRA